MKNQKVGRISYPYNYPPEAHELAIADVFAALGKDIEFILPSRIKNAHTPDIEMDGVQWEMKSPTGKDKKNIANVLRRALKQSKYVIIDIRRIKIPEAEAIAEIRRHAKLIKSLKQLKVVSSENIIDIM